jgi:hypothetical protein
LIKSVNKILPITIGLLILDKIIPNDKVQHNPYNW